MSSCGSNLKRKSNREGSDAMERKYKIKISKLTCESSPKPNGPLGTTQGKGTESAIEDSIVMLTFGASDAVHTISNNKRKVCSSAAAETKASLLAQPLKHKDSIALKPESIKIESVSKTDGTQFLSCAPIMYTFNTSANDIGLTGKTGKNVATVSDSEDASDYEPLMYCFSTSKEVKKADGSTKTPKRRRKFTSQAVKRLESMGMKAEIKVPNLETNPKRIGKRHSVSGESSNWKAVFPVVKLPCQLCGCEFTDSSNLRRHIKNVHFGKITQCAECGTKLSSERGWIEHMARFHN